MEEWFWENISFKIGDGQRISFWTDKWAVDQLLRVKFPQPFQICSNKEGKIGERLGICSSEDHLLTEGGWGQWSDMEG